MVYRLQGLNDDLPSPLTSKVAAILPVLFLSLKS